MDRGNTKSFSAVPVRQSLCQSIDPAVQKMSLTQRWRHRSRSVSPSLGACSRPPQTQQIKLGDNPDMKGGVFIGHGDHRRVSVLLCRMNARCAHPAGSEQRERIFGSGPAGPNGSRALSPC
jgi:hypothetical protein